MTLWLFGRPVWRYTVVVCVQLRSIYSSLHTHINLQWADTNKRAEATLTSTNTLGQKSPQIDLKNKATSFTELGKVSADREMLLYITCLIVLRKWSRGGTKDTATGSCNDCTQHNKRQQDKQSCTCDKCRCFYLTELSSSLSPSMSLNINMS